MYLDYFGLTRMPFETVSNASVYVDLADHRDALNTILFGLRSGEGFVKITGEVGTGKTALCRSLLDQLDDSFIPVYLPNPAMRRLDLLHAIADELDITMPPRGSHHLAHRHIREVLLEIARKGSRVVIFVDEAQTAPTESLEELRLLSNLESSQGRMVQVVLFGQPELDERLSRYSMRQLQQRITWTARLEPIDRTTCRDYIWGRLAAAGATRPETIFTPAAIERIHRASGGIPRLINVICHKALLAAVSESAYQVGRRHVGKALVDTEGVQRWQKRPLFSTRPGTRPLAQRWSSLTR